MTIHFTKMQGLGNDFVIIDATQSPFTLDSKHIQQMADRRYGVGFDQLLLIEPSDKADFGYRIFNADGSEVEQCGNGARCVAKYIVDRGLSDQTELVLQAQKGPIHCRLLGANAVQIEMGVPTFITEKEILELADHEVTVGVVDVGNPHAVLLCDDVTQAPVATVGHEISHHVFFPNRTNVEFVQVIDPQNIQLRVFERGVGETLACGSGACGAMAMAKRWGLVNDKVTVSQPGGDLSIEWSGQGAIKMTGPAITVFDGTWAAK